MDENFAISQSAKFPILEFDGIAKKFDSKSVLEDINFKIFPNETFGIVGPSGSGKTTLFRLILGYYTATKGKILFRGRKITKELNELRRLTGYTTQDDSFYGKLTVYENMRYYAHLYKANFNRRELKARITKLLNKVKLISSKDTLAKNLSGGMKRRLDFAISLIHDPEILVMDEPTSGLDPALAELFWKIINDLKAEGKTIIVTSHIFDEIEHNCDRVVVLNDGRIQATLNASEIEGTLIEKFNHLTQNE